MHDFILITAKRAQREAKIEGKHEKWCAYMFKWTRRSITIAFLLSVSFPTTSKAIKEFDLLICSWYSFPLKLWLPLKSMSISRRSPLPTAKLGLSMGVICKPQSSNVVSIKPTTILKKNNTKACPSSRIWTLYVWDSWRATSTDLFILKDSIACIQHLVGWLIVSYASNDNDYIPLASISTSIYATHIYLYI